MFVSSLINNQLINDWMIFNLEIASQNKHYVLSQPETMVIFDSTFDCDNRKTYLDSHNR